MPKKRITGSAGAWLAWAKSIVTDFGPRAASGLAAGGLAAFAIGQEPGYVPPQSDSYSTYADAFHNPDTVCPPGGHGYGQSAAHGNTVGSHTSKAMGGLWSMKPFARLYYGQDVIYFRRSNPANRVLVDVSPNLFEGFVDGGDHFLNAESTGAPLFNIADRPKALTTDATPPDILELLDDPSLRAPNTPDFRSNVPAGILLPQDVRMTTDSLDSDGEFGFRHRMGLALQNGDSIEFSYLWTKDVGSAIVDDVSGSAFLTTVISTGDPFALQFQRFGFLRSPFQTDDFRFFGEARITLPDDDSPTPHFPPNERPPVLSDQSDDVPREPTNDDPILFGSTDVLNDTLLLFNDLYENSLLWTDGEIASARYAYDMQNADITYRRPIMSFYRGNYSVDLLVGIKYMAMDEFFGFYFADVSGTNTIPFSGGQTPRDPFDRAVANPFPQAQPAAEAQATYIMSIDNDIVGPQAGLDVKFPFWTYFDVQVMSKAGIMANFMSNQTSLERGDGLRLFDYSKESTVTSGVWEGVIGANFYPHPNVKLRGGWEYIALFGVGTAVSNIEFDLDRRPRPSNDEDLLWSGWYAGAEISF